MAEYINRESIMKFPIRKDHCDKEHANDHFINGIESVLEYAENLPAADVAPVVHGRWEKAQDMRRMDGHIYDYRCSLCDSLAEKGVYNNYDRLTNYCPNCGAKMDGGDGDAAD